MLQCWNKEDNTRLHMAEIHDKLERWFNFPEFLERKYSVIDKK